MHVTDIKRLISAGEGEYLEFKHRVPDAERIAKEVIALANTRGGKLLLGVGDDGTIEGLRDVAEEAFVLEQALREHCVPRVDYSTMVVLAEDGREILVVDVPESDDKPHFLVVEGSDEQVAYIRVRDESLEASPEAVELMYEEEEESLRFEFGKKEQMLMRYLDQYERVTVKEFARLANISKRAASETLTHLVRINILHLHATGKSDFFTLSYDYLP